MILDSVTPPDLLFPSRFASYRRAQVELAEFSLYGPGGGDIDIESLRPRRFACCGAPPGSGKSLVAHTIGKLSGMKYAILTATKALEDQQCADFVDGSEVVNIRGRANYSCVGLNSPLSRRRVECNCEEGAGDYDCPLAGKPGCAYADRVQDARRARGIVTNYAYWIAARMQNPRALEMGGERIGLLIADEAHLAADNLARALATWVSNEDLHRWAPETRELIRQVKGQEWGRVTIGWLAALEDVTLGARARLGAIELQYGDDARRTDEHKRLTRLFQGVSRVVLHGGDNNWIWRQTRNGVSFDCIWPGRYAEQYLWSGVEKVVLLSATLVPKAMQFLRIPTGDYHFREWPRQFPKANSPVWWIPTGRMRHGSSEEEKSKCVAIGDRIFAAWSQYKGLVHSQSYTRAEWLQARCEWGRHMHINERGDATGNLERFLRADPPAVLVSPSYTTGTDLPDSSCRWIWIPKMPFPDRSDPLVIARSQDDEDYYNYETMQTLVQACGRGTRSETDWSVTMVTDDNVGNFRNYARRFAPKWFEVKKWEEGGVPLPR